MITVDEIAPHPGGPSFECYSPQSDPAELDAMALRVGLKPPSKLQPPSAFTQRASGRSTRMLLWCLCRMAEGKTVALSVPNRGLNASRAHHVRRLGAELRDLVAKLGLRDPRVILMNSLGDHCATDRLRGLDPRRSVIAIDHAD